MANKKEILPESSISYMIAVNYPFIGNYAYEHTALAGVL